MSPVSPLPIYTIPFAAQTAVDQGPRDTVRYWVLNPDGHPQHDALARAIAYSCGAVTAYPRRLMVMLGTVGALTIAAVATCVTLGKVYPAVLSAGAGLLAVFALVACRPPQIRLDPKPAVARPIRQDDEVHVVPEQADALVREGFSSPAHRALWQALVARDATIELDRAITDATFAEQSVLVDAHRRSVQLQQDRQRAHDTFTELVARNQLAPEATATLRAVLDRVPA